MCGPFLPQGSSSEKPSSVLENTVPGIRCVAALSSNLIFTKLASHMSAVETIQLTMAGVMATDASFQFACKCYVAKSSCGAVVRTLPCSAAIGIGTDIC